MPNNGTKVDNPPMDEPPMPPIGNEPPAPAQGMNEPEPPMTDAPMGDEPKDGDNDEIMSLIDKLSIEDKLAAKKYIQSMVDDNDGGEENTEEAQESDMPMESKKNIGELVNEIVNSVLADFDDDTSDREDNIIRNKKVSNSNPFKSKY